MNRPFSPTSLAWLALVVVSAVLLTWIDGHRIGEIERVSQLVPGAATDDTSPTGYVRRNRNLILPEKTPSGQPWIMDVQHDAAQNPKPTKHAAYDNAPEGRAVYGASPYRWWLRLIAGAEGLIGNYSTGRAIERAALHANPVLHGLLCLGAGLFVAWRFGAAAGGLLALGIAGLFPLTTAFAPGQPDDHALLLAANLIGVLLLLSGTQATERGAARLWFALAGFAAGFGLWLDASSQAAVLGAVWLGGLLVALFGGQVTSGDGLSGWRWWAIGGAAMATAGWIVEGRPGGFTGVDLDTNHPLLALAWMAGIETLIRLQRWRQGGAGKLDFVVLVGSAAAFVFGPGWLLHQGGSSDLLGPNGSLLGAQTAAKNLVGWYRGEGTGLALVASLLPLLLIPIAVGLFRQSITSRQPVLIALTMAIAFLALSLFQLRWWGLLNISILGSLVALAAGLPATPTRLWFRAAIALLLLPSFALAWPKKAASEELSAAQARALIERDLAQWLAARSEPGTIAFAPPALSASLCYYGGLGVIGSPYPGNQDGIAMTVRIASTTSVDEAHALVQKRGIRYIILPSWDNVLDELAKIGSPKPEQSLVALLRQWLPPRWLRPVPYQLPTISGMAEDSVALFEVVEPQENAIALSRLAEYFVETGRLDLAAAVSSSLQQSFASDAAAMIARAQVALARGDNKNLALVMTELLPAIADGRDEDLPWERRANLAIVLAQAKRSDLARPQIAFCMEEATEEHLRSLGTVSLYRLLVLARAYNRQFAEPGLQETARGLLPEEFRNQVPH